MYIETTVSGKKKLSLDFISKIATGCPKKEPPKLITYKKVGTRVYWLPCRLGILW